MQMLFPIIISKMFAPYISNLNFKTDSQEIIRNTTAKDMEGWLKDGQFWRGTMEPKIKAALYFLNHHGEEVIITSIENIGKAIQKQAGTRILKN